MGVVSSGRTMARHPVLRMGIAEAAAFRLLVLMCET